MTFDAVLITLPVNPQCRNQVLGGAEQVEITATPTMVALRLSITLQFIENLLNEQRLTLFWSASTTDAIYNRYPDFCG